MKKLLSISFALLLMVSTIGITVHKHYCDSVLVATSVLPHGEDDTCNTEMPMPSNSCEDQHEHYNVDSPLVLLAIQFELTPSVEWVTAAEMLFVDFYTKDFITPEFYADISPPPSEPNIYTKVQSFLL